MSGLLINEPPLQVLPTLAQRIGVNEAIMLQQVHYWLNPRLNNNLSSRHRVQHLRTMAAYPFWGIKTVRRVNICKNSAFESFYREISEDTYAIDYTNCICRQTPKNIPILPVFLVCLRFSSRPNGRRKSLSEASQGTQTKAHQGLRVMISRKTFFP